MFELIAMTAKAIYPVIPLLMAVFMLIAAYGTPRGTIEHMELVMSMYFWSILFVLFQNERKQS